MALLITLTNFYVIGCENVDGFEAVAKGEKVNYKKSYDRYRRISSWKTSRKALLMECTELPCYSDTLRASTALLVFDAITMINFFYSSCTDNPNFGINDWD